MDFEKIVNPVVKDIPPSGIRKFFDLANQMEGVISLGVGEPDFATPWTIREAAIYSIEKGKTFYTANQGLLELRKEICKYQKRRFNLDYKPEQCIVTVGESEGIDLQSKLGAREGRGQLRIPTIQRFSCRIWCNIQTG